MEKVNKVKKTERGWAGHFIAASSCKYHRNTLLEYRNKKIIVSTVGNYRIDGKAKEIGCDRYYETMVFEARKDGVYWEVDVEKEIGFHSDWSLNELKEETDLKADTMHEQVVNIISSLLLNKSIT